MRLPSGDLKRGNNGFRGAVMGKECTGFHTSAALRAALGIDHEELVYPHQGRYFRLTDVSGSVVRGILS